MELMPNVPDQPVGETGRAANFLFIVVGLSSEPTSNGVSSSKLKKFELVGRDVDRQTAETLDIDWFYRSQRGPRERSSSQEMMETINGLNKLMKLRRFEQVDTILESVDPSAISPEMMLAFLRTTFAVRSMLIGWRGLAEKIRKELGSRGYESSVLMKGLL